MDIFIHVYYHPFYYCFIFISNRTLTFLQAHILKKKCLKPLLAHSIKNKIPDIVFDNIERYTPNYSFKTFDDDDIVVLFGKYYPSTLLTTFKALKMHT